MSAVQSTTTTAPAASTAKAQPGDDLKLKKACVAFEGEFFNMMLQEMRKTVPDDPLLGDDAHQQEIFQQMMDDQVSQDMAKHGGSGDLASQLYSQLSKAAHLSAAQSGAGSDNGAATNTALAPLHGAAQAPISIRSARPAISTLKKPMETAKDEY